jgi:hypothetical protein
VDIQASVASVFSAGAFALQWEGMLQFSEHEGDRNTLQWGGEDKGVLVFFYQYGYRDLVRVGAQM